MSCESGKTVENARRILGSWITRREKFIIQHPSQVGVRFHLNARVPRAFTGVLVTTDRDKLRFAAYKASDFLERRLFFRTKGMRIFAVLIEPSMSA